MANKPYKFTFAANSTAGSTGYASFPTGVSQAHATFNNVTTSTKDVVKLQGGIGEEQWFDLSAATTLSTSVDNFGSTVTAVFDRVRFQVTSKGTNTGTNTVYIIAK